MTAPLYGLENDFIRRIASQLESAVMTNEAIKVLMIFALYGTLEVILCFSSFREIKAALTMKAARSRAAEPRRSAVKN